MASEELQLDQQLRATTQCWSWKLLLGPPPPLELPPATCRGRMELPSPDATPIAIATRVWKLEQLMGCMTDGHGVRLHVHMYERQGACVSARTYRTHARRIWNVMLCIKKLASNACTCTYTCMLQHDFLCVRADLQIARGNYLRFCNHLLAAAFAAFSVAYSPTSPLDMR